MYDKWCSVKGVYTPFLRYMPVSKIAVIEIEYLAFKPAEENHIYRKNRKRDKTEKMKMECKKKNGKSSS